MKMKRAGFQAIFMHTEADLGRGVPGLMGAEYDETVPYS